MSFLVAVYIHEGIVLASDRRTTYTNTQTIDGKVVKRIGIHTTNSTEKTFACPNGAGISCCGDASVSRKPITGFIQDMIRSEISEECQIERMPQIIIDYFNRLSDPPDCTFLVAGYDSIDGKKTPAVFSLNIKSKKIRRVNTSECQGAIWEGATSTLTRLIQNVALKTDDNEYFDLPYEEILWEYFTLQDAVDFARYAVETTIQTMRFKNVVETVGGAVDVLVITPDGTTWLQKESLQ